MDDGHVMYLSKRDESVTTERVPGAANVACIRVAEVDSGYLSVRIRKCIENSIKLLCIAWFLCSSMSDRAPFVWDFIYPRPLRF